MAPVEHELRSNAGRMVGGFRVGCPTHRAGSAQGTARSRATSVPDPSVRWEARPWRTTCTRSPRFRSARSDGEKAVAYRVHRPAVRPAGGAGDPAPLLGMVRRLRHRDPRSGPGMRTIQLAPRLLVVRGMARRRLRGGRCDERAATARRSAARRDGAALSRNRARVRVRDQAAAGAPAAGHAAVERRGRRLSERARRERGSHRLGEPRTALRPRAARLEVASRDRGERRGDVRGRDRVHESLPLRALDDRRGRECAPVVWTLAGRVFGRRRRAQRRPTTRRCGRGDGVPVRRRHDGRADRARLAELVRPRDRRGHDGGRARMGPRIRSPRRLLQGADVRGALPVDGRCPRDREGSRVAEVRGSIESVWMARRRRRRSGRRHASAALAVADSRVRPSRAGRGTTRPPARVGRHALREAGLPDRDGARRGRRRRRRRLERRADRCADRRTITRRRTRPGSTRRGAASARRRVPAPPRAPGSAA